MISDKLRPFGTTIFTEMTVLANQHGAINLSQGFPDFEGPPELIDFALAAMKSGDNQYARSMGHPKLVEAVARHAAHFYAMDVDPMQEVVVFCGATEGLASSMLGLLNPGDEVVLIEPFYDSYPACVALAQATPRFATLKFPDFRITEELLRPLFNARTRLLVFNSPHNPTGRVFTREEMDVVARLCQEFGVQVLADEVYEHILYDDVAHVPIATLPGMRERTLTLSSTGKTFSMTGWKIGWGVGPASLVAAAQAAHQFITFAIATPLQRAMAEALGRFQDDFVAQLQAEYAGRRDFLAGVLAEAGFRVAMPKGAYFLLADFSDLHDGTDREYARHLIENYQVAAIPPTAFYKQNPQEGQKLLRFAFCKRMETLQKAAANLKRLRS